MNTRIILSAAIVMASLASFTGCKTDKENDNLDVKCIWSQNYSAFPSIVKFQGKYYVAFREAQSHIFDEDGEARGAARILVSQDGEQWESAALLKKEGYDLRDPKLSVTPDGRLMVTIGGSVYRDKKLTAMIPHVSFSSDGQNFSPSEPVVFDDKITDDREWIWRVTWNGDTGYGVTYGEHFALVSTKDGVHYDTVTELDVDRANAPGESTIRFAPDGKMLMMVRCDAGDKKGRWGVSEAPYTEWTWSTIDLHLGGQDFIVKDDGTVVVGTRCTFEGNMSKTVTMVGGLDGQFNDIHILPSGGDTSYPGFLEVGDRLWMVYYSCHESREGTTNGTMYHYDPSKSRKHQASIYLAKLPSSTTTRR